MIDDNLKFHSNGKLNHLKALEDTFKSLKDEVKTNDELSKKHKKTALKQLRNTFFKEKKNLQKNIY